MSSRNNRTPISLLEPYLRLPPEAALLLLTGTLGCSVSWLTARFVGSLLLTPQNVSAGGGRGPEGVGDDGTKRLGVVLVSWTRDLTFSNTELRRSVGVDIAKLARDEEGRFGFVDCFTTLSPFPEEEEKMMAELEERITAAITQPTTAAARQKRRVVLILDSPDALLALKLCTAQALHTLLLRLRSLAPVHSMILTCSADSPLLLSAATSDAERLHPITPLEAETAAFAVQQAHNARFVLSVRELETGAAGDISGVLRVTRGGAAYDSEDGVSGEEAEEEEEVKEMEALYLVQRDGSAKVFERGSNDM
ncbi:hypothetical protein LTR74_016020 [Friedmanniomyces endolithicus]|nr:hypothetical protein LTR74_016020 [Friedmanniomyces endolithicus]